MNKYIEKYNTIMNKNACEKGIADKEQIYQGFYTYSGISNC